MSNPIEESLTDTARLIADTYAAHFTEVLEAMTGERPDVKATGTPEASDDIDWWEQQYSLPDTRVWIGSTKETWSGLGQKALSAAGIEEADEQDVRQTYQELLQQALSAVGQAVGPKVGDEVVCTDGQWGGDSPDSQPIQLEVQYSGSSSLLMQIVVGQAIQKAVEAASQKAEAAAPPPAPPPVASPPVDYSAEPAKPIELLLDVDLPVSISFGRAHLQLKDVLKLTSGSIVELNRPVSEPVEVIVNNCVIARGEVVVVDGNYGVRINQIISRRDRIQTLN